MTLGSLAVLCLVGALVSAVAAPALALRGHSRAACGAIVVLAALLRAYAGSDPFLHEWDERFHALVAKHLMSHPLRPTLYEDPVLPYDYRNWFENHIWLHKPPLALWLMALGMKLAGVNELGIRLPSLLLSTASVLLTCRIGHRLVGPSAALLAAFFHAISGLLIALAAGRTATDHVDTAFLFLFELAVLLSLGVANPSSPAPSGRGSPWRRAVAAGLVLGLALLAKSFVAFLLVPLIMAFDWAREVPGHARRSLARIAAASAVVCLLALAVWAPWQIYVSRAFPAEAAWETRYSLAHVLEPLETHGGGPLFHLWRMPRLFGELVYLPLGWFLWTAMRRGAERSRIALALWLVVPYAFFSLVATKMPAYVMVSAPAVFMMAADWCSRLWAARSGPRGRVCVAALVLMIALPVRTSIEGLKLLRSSEPHPTWAAQLRDLKDRWPGQRVVIFNSTRPIETMFYTPFTAYPSVPSTNLVRELTGKGYTIAVFKGRELPPELEEAPGVTLLGP